MPLESSVDWPRSAVLQYTNAELRQRVRHTHGLRLLSPVRVRAWRMMAYGVLLERRKLRCDRATNGR